MAHAGNTRPVADSTCPLSAEWRSVDTCAVSDALDRLGHRGFVPGIVPVAGTAAVVGRAVTVELGPLHQGTSARHLGTAAVEAAEPGDVIVIGHQGRLDCAGWGGNLSLASHLAGLSGVVVDGACRDVAEATALGFAVFARGVTARTARGRVQELSYQQPVVVGDVTVHPGDLVIADACGVVFVSREVEAAVMEVAIEIVNREAAMAADIRSGVPVSHVMGASYENMTRPRPEAIEMPKPEVAR